MKAVSAGVKIGVLFLLATGGGYATWKNLSNDAAGTGGYPLTARFRDAAGLPVGSKVMLAGMPVGQVTKLSIDGRYARVQFRIRGDVKVWDSAAVVKKSKSLLGDHYLELDPGLPETLNAEGSKVAHIQLQANEAIPRVIEATSPDDLMHRSQATLEKVDALLLSLSDLTSDVRGIMNGPMASVASRIDALVQKEAGNVSQILERANATMGRIEQITGDVRKLTSAADDQVLRILTSLDAAAAEAKELVQTARGEVELTGRAVRTRLDQLDGVIGHSESIAAKVDRGDGTIGKLVNDPTIANNVGDLSDGANQFLGTVFGLKTYVGLRTEYNVFAGLARHYISAELHTRPDKFYLLEIVQDPRGGYPETTLTLDPTVSGDTWTRRSVIADSLRFTFQFGKRFSWLTLRYGIKESAGGVGADVSLFAEHPLRLSADIYDTSFDRLPRVKLTAAWAVFRNLYILGGIEDMMNTPRSLQVNTGGGDTLAQFDHVRVGRDYFLGGMLRFNDEDLAALLTIGGSALAGLNR